MAKRLDRILYVRVPEALLSDLDRLVEIASVEHPGHSISRADVVRELLYEKLRPQD